MSEDTYTGEVNDPLSLNLYTYCANNPVIYTDPTGHRYNFLTGGDDGTGSSIVIGVSNSGTLISVPRESNNSGSVFNIPQTSGLITYNYNNSFGNSTLNINNDGDIRTLNTGNLSVNLNNTGTIGRVSTGDNSVTNINNSGYIGVINSGVGSKTNITNSGYIGVALGAKSTYNINGIVSGSNSYSAPLYLGANTAGFNSNLDIIISNIKELERLANEMLDNPIYYRINTQNANELVLQFIRRTNYNNPMWDLTAAIYVEHLQAMLKRIILRCLHFLAVEEMVQYLEVAKMEILILCILQQL